MILSEGLFGRYFRDEDGLRLPDDPPAVLTRAASGLQVPDRWHDIVEILYSLVSPFMARCLDMFDWSRYAIVGFSVTFHQMMASLALARRIKERHPGVRIAVGGGRCESPAADALLRAFDFLDAVFVGKAEISFPAYIEAVCGRGDLSGVRGLVYRQGTSCLQTSPPIEIERLDDLPVPDYTEFFEQHRRSPLHNVIPTYLLVETSRGCWWADYNKCLFCGLNGPPIPFRRKSVQRVISEVRTLTDSHGERFVVFADSILSPAVFHSVLPALAADSAGPTGLRDQGECLPSGYRAITRRAASASSLASKASVRPSSNS